MLRTLLICRFVLIIATIQLLFAGNPASAHFYGGTTTKVTDRYSVTFVPVPGIPVAGDKSTRLQFSVLDNNSDIYNVYAALVVTKKGTAEPTANLPYKPYVFSDITFPTLFNDTGDYNVTIYTLISGDPEFRTLPLKASFDLKVTSPFQATISSTSFSYTITVLSIAAAAGTVSYYIYKKR